MKIWPACSKSTSISPYTKDDYDRQFTIRVPENLAKLDRVEKIFTYKVPDTPEILLVTFDLARNRLKSAAEKFGDYISPFDLIEK